MVNHARSCLRCNARRWGRAIILSLTCVAAGVALADPQPTDAMMRPVHDLVAFLSSLPPGTHPDVFVPQGLCIIENFEPYILCGADAASRWEAGLRAHFSEGLLADLVARFEPAHEFAESGQRAYFSLPTTWTGTVHGRRFREIGAWTFVVECHSGGWRIGGYSWGQTSYSETPE